MKKLNLIILIIISLSFLSCKLFEKDEEGGGSNGNSGKTITISGTLSMNTSLTEDLEKGLDDYKVVCVTFATIPNLTTGAVASDGTFSVKVAKDTEFTCSVTTDDYTLVASLVVTGLTDEFGTDTADSALMAFKTNVTLGSLTLNTDTGVVSVPAAQIESAVTTAPSISFDVTNMHDKAYQMTCESITGQNDDECADFISEGNTVYFRIFQATKESKTIYGTSIWKDKASFTTCEGDMLQSVYDDLIGTGISFSDDYAPTVVSNFNADGCDNEGDYDEDGNDTADGDPDNRYGIGKLHKRAAGYEYRDEDSDTHTGGPDNTYVCDWSYRMSVIFTPLSTDGSLFIGRFSMSETFSANHAGACGDQDNSYSSFLVRFTQQ